MSCNQESDQDSLGGLGDISSAALDGFKAFIGKRGRSELVPKRPPYPEPRLK
mgnify:CR=1 FL=1